MSRKAVSAVKIKITTKPIKMWIDGKCYNLKQYSQDKYKTLLQETKCNKNERRNSMQHDANTSMNIKTPEHNKSETDDSENTGKLITQNEKLFDINIHENGKFISSFQVPKFYYGKLKNFCGLDYLHTISNETNTNISVPLEGEPGKLSVLGDNEDSVVDAVTELHSVIGKIRDQNMALQFIGIPCLSQEIKENFETFKSEILNGDKINGMQESIFQSPLKLHVTVNILVLLDDREKSEAIQALEDYKNTVLEKLTEKTGPLKLHVCGIDCMQENLKKVDVLYAKVKIVNETDENSLQKLVNDLSHYFYERGLLKRYEESIKLHMTLINTKYRRLPNSPKRSRWAKRQSFDARSVIKRYKDYDFGYCNLESIHLSLISSKGEDGFYLPLSIIRVNKE